MLRRIVGLEPELVVDGVRYHARSGEPLRRALSPTGRGSKEYDAQFPTGERMRIRVTRRRHFADLLGPGRLDLYRASGNAVRPGLRVLDLASGTGAGAAWLAERVGPSGAVVALEEDGASVRYARRRYAAPNIAYEITEERSLEGEPDGAFDAVFLIASPGSLTDRPDAVRARLVELPRLLAPGGFAHIASDLADDALAEQAERLAETLGGPVTGAGTGPGVIRTIYSENRGSGPGAAYAGGP
ncbi:MAG: class I SAM-dependent methyltransferase [Planctomycetota bacterium]